MNIEYRKGRQISWASEQLRLSEIPDTVELVVSVNLGILFRNYEYICVARSVIIVCRRTGDACDWTRLGLVAVSSDHFMFTAEK
jgi:hypothetical protein